LNHLNIHRNMKIMKEILENDFQVFAGVEEMTKYTHKVSKASTVKVATLTFSESKQFLQNFCAFM